jgi:hypothetical protein
VAALPETPPPAPNGVAPQGPSGPPDQWIVIGPRTRAQLAAQLERSMGVLLLALLETSGAPEGAGYTLVLDGAHLEPVPPVPPPSA